MAVYGQSAQLMDLLNMHLISNPNAMTLAEYLEVGTAYPGMVIVNYLLGKGVPKTFTFRQLLASPQYFNDMSEAIKITTVIADFKKDQDTLITYGQDSGIDVPQHAMTIEPQNQYMSYKPSNKSISDYINYNGTPVNYPPISWTSPDGADLVLELYNCMSVLGDGTLIYEAWDNSVGGGYYFVAMRKSSHNPNDMVFVDAIEYTPQFNINGYSYTIKNNLNSVTFYNYSYSTFSNLENYSTILTIDTKGKLSVKDTYKVINSGGILGVYNELIGGGVTNIQYNSRDPLYTMNDNFYEMMAGSKMGTHYFLIYQSDTGSGFNSIDQYQNIVAINYLTGTYELIDAKAKLQEAVDAGNFPNAWGDLSDAFYGYQEHPEGLLFRLHDDNSTNGYNLEGVTRVWSAEWTNYLNPTPLTSRFLDDEYSTLGTFSSYYGNIFDWRSDDKWNLSPEYAFVFFNTTQTYSGYNKSFQKSGPVENHIYRFKLNSDKAPTLQEPELQSIAKYTPDFKKQIATADSGSSYRATGGDSVSSYSGYYNYNNVEYAYQFPTSEGMLFGYFNNVSRPYYWGNKNPYGELNVNYWADNSNKPVALGSNLGALTNHTNNTLYSTYSSYYRMVRTVNSDNYKGQNFGI